MVDPTQNPLNIENSESLRSYLLDMGHIGDKEIVQFKVLAGGVSNRTVLVYRQKGRNWVLKQALPKLRVKVDWFSDPSRILREAEGIRWLNLLAPQGTVPPLVFEDRERHILAMEAVPEPHENWKNRLLHGDIHRSHIEQFAHIVATIHRRSSEAREEFQGLFEDRSFFEDLRVEPYYRYTAEREPKAFGFLDRLISETLSRRDCLVHGDYSPKNILVHKDRLHLLDHEVIHFGDPSFDLGFSMTHLLSKGLHLPRLRSRFVKAVLQYWADYRANLGNVGWADYLEERAVRQTLGCLLARVAGRSPLEYLTDEEKSHQRRAVLQMMASPPRGIEALIAKFYGRV